MSAAKNTAKCIARFTYGDKLTNGDKQCRLLAKGKWSEGYEDSYVIEQLGADELGDPRWDRYTDFKNDEYNNGLPLRLVFALRQVQSEQRGDVVEKIAAFVATFPEGLAIADAIREGRFE